ncbi:hypothetical protein ACLOJK_022242 [Asimina triloba]
MGSDQAQPSHRRICPSAPLTPFIFRASHPNLGDSNEGFIIVSPLCARVHWLSLRAASFVENHPFPALASAPKQPISLDRPSLIACASSLPQPAPLLQRRLGRDRALFSICVCVRRPYKCPCSPSVSSARPSLLARCVYSHPPFSGNLAFRIFPSSPLCALCPCSPFAFCPSSSRTPLLSVCISPISVQCLRQSRLPNHNHRLFSVSLVFPPFPSSLLRLQPPSPFSGSLASRPSLLARHVFPPTVILPSPAVSSFHPSLLACCVIPWFVHPAFSGHLVFLQLGFFGCGIVMGESG